MTTSTLTSSVLPPVSTPLAATMKVDFLFNEEGEVWLLHDRPLPDIFSWAEYDVELQTLIFVTEDGTSVPLGLQVPATSKFGQREVREITTLLIDAQGQIAGSAVLPVILRDLAAI